MLQSGRCNRNECLHWTLGNLFPCMHMTWSICLMPRKLFLSCHVHPYLPTLCLEMEVCRNPYCFIVNAILFFLPSFKLWLCTEPMHAINYSICQYSPYAPAQGITYTHPSMLHLVWQMSQSSRSMEAAYSIVQPVLIQGWLFWHGDLPERVVVTLVNLQMHPGSWGMHPLPYYSSWHADELRCQRYELQSKHVSWFFEFWHLGPGFGTVLTWIPRQGESCGWSHLPEHSVVWIHLLLKTWHHCWHTTPIQVLMGGEGGYLLHWSLHFWRHWNAALEDQKLRSHPYHQCGHIPHSYPMMILVDHLWADDGEGTHWPDAQTCQLASAGDCACSPLSETPPEWDVSLQLGVDI